MSRSENDLEYLGICVRQWRLVEGRTKKPSDDSGGLHGMESEIVRHGSIMGARDRAIEQGRDQGANFTKRERQKQR